MKSQKDYCFGLKYFSSCLWSLSFWSRPNLKRTTMIIITIKTNNNSSHIKNTKVKETLNNKNLTYSV